MKLYGTFLLLAGLAGCLVGGPALAQYGHGNVIHCASLDYRDNYCPANTHGGVHIVRQTSHAPCSEGESWGYDRRGIWVTHGCAADFQVGGGRGGYDHDGGYGGRGNDHYDRRNDHRRGGQRVICESRDFRYNYCPIHGGHDVDLVIQHSKSPCRHGTSWGWDRGGIWVDQGCAAEFVVY